MKSMTGFGSQTVRFKDLEITIEISTINKRNLEIFISLPREWQNIEKNVSDLVKKFIHRGKVNINAKPSPISSEKSFAWNEVAINETLEQLVKYSKKNNITCTLDMNLLFNIAKSTFTFPNPLPNNPQFEKILLGGIKKALDLVNRSRKAEARVLSKDVSNRLKLLSKGTQFIQKKAHLTVPHYRNLLYKRLKEANLEINLNDERVLKEIALFADKCDISEELTRLQSHIYQFSDEMKSSLPAGRKMDFLCQEMNRELNTIGSKANNLQVTQQVIDLKNELERIREQIQNIE